MSSEIAIKVANLSKCYQIYERPRDRLKQFLLPKLQRITGTTPKRYYREFWALKNVSFEVRRGETVGVIGRNGSGKSTLLQIICGTLNATSGIVETHGRVAALLELGSGFNPDFTGRENVYMNAAVFGLTKEEIDRRFDAIVGFADIGEFIDQPVKTYSSGMVVRLAFSVQSQIDPDILIIDEALAVGDVKFQTKCFDRLRRLKENGTSILLVTHSSEQIVTHCSKAVLLDGGNQLEVGEPKDVVNLYMDILFGKEKTHECEQQSTSVNILHSDTLQASNKVSLLEDKFSIRPGYNPHEYRWGDGSATIMDYYFSADDEPYPSAVNSGQHISLIVSIKFHTDFYRPILGVTIKTKEGVTVYGANSETLECDDFHALVKAGTVIVAEATFICRLAPGDYFISLGVASKEGENIIPHDRRYDAIHLQVKSNSKFFGIADLGLQMSIEMIE